MKRNQYMSKLKAWATSPRRKPLILEGARQVGKTWLMREFAKENFRNVVYARFDKDSILRDIFGRDFDVTRIVHELEIQFHTRISADDTVLLFDEIQACGNAITALKYFCEDRPDIPVIAAGSLLGLTYRNEEDQGKFGGRTTGFPVGKVSMLPVYPMSFGEFLVALGEERLCDELKSRNWQDIGVFHEKLADLLRHYYVIGGMPEAVLAFCETRNFIDVRQIHSEILSGYEKDISKHAPKSDIRKIAICWNSIPGQLARENKKFTYSALKKGGRAAEFRDPLAWLEGAGLIHIVPRAKLPLLPLSAYCNDCFKVYALDVGLLSTMSGLDPRVVLEGPRVFREFKGALTEQYVHQQLISETAINPCYWSTDDSRTEVDFIFQRGMEVFPLEVKAESNIRSQSLASYVRRFSPSIVYRASMLPYAEQKLVQAESGAESVFINIPLYAVGEVLK